MIMTEDTILSWIQKFTAYDSLPTAPRPAILHPFSTPASITSFTTLQQLADASTALANALGSYSSGLQNASIDSKLVSKLRQCSALVDSLHASEQDSRRRIDAFSKRTGILFGEPIPLDRNQLVEWCFSRIESWGAKAGMETFTDHKKDEGKTSMVLGGKVLVIDVEFIVCQEPNPRIEIASVKTSHALPSATSTNALAERSASLDEAIFVSWKQYLEEVQRDDLESSLKAAHMAKSIQEQLEYLMKLDELAFREGNQGIRWFNDVGLMSSVSEQIVNTEALAIASALSITQAPLDVFLNRAHALPLPYLTGPSMSFLVHLSPLAYFTLLSKTQPQHNPNATQSSDWKLDISMTTLREYLRARTSRPAGTTIATLSLSPSFSFINNGQETQLSLLSDSLSSTDIIPNFDMDSLDGGRPYFRLPGTNQLVDLDHILPLPSSSSAGLTVQGIYRIQQKRDEWMLDFTDGGRSEGVVMTHTRMREIRRVIQRSETTGSIQGMGMQMPPYPGNWVALLLNSIDPPSERYIAVYTSPSSAHPPLRLRLTAPNEAGFFLSTVPVRSLKEALAVLEIVRCQCWINEALKTCNWVPEEHEQQADLDPSNQDPATVEADLNALLNGTYIPKRIPVNVFIPFQPIQQLSAFDANGGGSETSSSRLLMTLTASDTGSTPSMSSQLHISVAHDITRAQGVRVDVGGTLPYTTQQVSSLEEFARRGGIFGVAGRVWKWAAS